MAALLLSLAFRAQADLPVPPAPKGFVNNDWLTLIKGYIRDGGVTLGLAVSVIGFLWISYTTVAKFNEARNGRAEWAEVGLLGVVAAGVLLFIRHHNQDLEATVTQRVQAAVGAQTTTAVGDLSRRLDQVSQQLHTLLAAPTGRQPAVEPPPAPAGPSPDTVIWVEPLDRPAPAALALEAASVRPAATVTPDAGTTPAGMATRPPVDATRTGRRVPVAYYTVPRNATLIGSTALTALIGRIPVGGRLIDPMPFKVLVGADNLAANGLTIPNVDGMVFSGLAQGDWTLACVTGRLTSVTFLFHDGTIRTLSADDQTGGGLADGYAGASLSGADTARASAPSLGWLSDARGVPCISGERITDAASYLTQRTLMGAVETAARALAAGETTSTMTPLGGSTTTLTGDAARYAGAQALAGGISELRQWLDEHQRQPFDVVYVKPATPVALHLDQELRIDYDPAGRKLSHDRASPAYPAGRLD